MLMRQGSAGAPLTWTRTGIGLRQPSRRRAACSASTGTNGLMPLISILAWKRRLVMAILEVADLGLGRPLPPEIVTAIAIVDRRGRQFLRGDIVQGGDLDRDEVAAQLGDVAVTEGAHAASRAESVMTAHRAELIVAQAVLT